MIDRTRKHPFVIGLTGSIGMGKTETGKMFARLGIPVCSADDIVHRLYDAGGSAVERIAEAFPGTVRGGRVDRETLSKQVAGDEAAFQRLEAIVHPLVRQSQQDFLRAPRNAAMSWWCSISRCFSRPAEKNAWTPWLSFPHPHPCSAPECSRDPA